VALAAIAVAAAVILGVSAVELQKERRRLLDELSASQSALAADAARDLGARLDAMDHDTQILTGLVSRTRQPARLDVATENRVLQSAFEALVAVVAHYRTIALYGADGAAAVTAVDPTEDRETVARALFDSGRGLAQAVARSRQPLFHGPIMLAGANGRSFYLFAVPAGADEVIVVASDAGMFLHAALPQGSSDGRYFVVDPRGVVWRGCEQSARCGPTSGGATSALLAEGRQPETRWLGREDAVGVGLAPAPALLASAPAAAVGGSWRLAIIRSAAHISDRQSALLRQLFITGLAAALAVAAVGAVILRQQRQAAVLQERLHSTQELATLREKSDAIIENAPVGILGMTEDGRVANRFLADRMGPIDIGRPWKDAFSAAAGGAGRLRALLERCGVAPPGPGAALGGDGAESVEPISGAEDFDVRIVSLRHPADEVRLFALIEDRSQVRELERQLIRTEKILTAAVLSAGLAHEIGTPISVIRGRAENLLESQAGTPAAEDLAAIVRHADRISSTIRQVLDFSRAQPIHVGPVEAAAAIEKTRQLLDWKLTSKRVSLAIAVAPGTRPLAADPDQLQQVLVNLIMNACDACAEGGAIRIGAGPAAGAEQVRLDVQDDGCGIPVEDLNAVFDPFFTTKKRGEGTGLGLTVVASIVRNHGGVVTVASVPGRGSTFTLLWPAAGAGRRA
jgi:signal transduction histidine kinase